MVQGFGRNTPNYDRNSRNGHSSIINGVMAGYENKTDIV